jgi:hypothetical protein
MGIQAGVVGGMGDQAAAAAMNRLKSAREAGLMS